jgi:hypothetical protein
LPNKKAGKDYCKKLKGPHQFPSEQIIAEYKEARSKELQRKGEKQAFFHIMVQCAGCGKKKSWTEFKEIPPADRIPYFPS